MTAAKYLPHAPVVIDLTGHDLRSRLDDALGIYVAAMGYPRGTEQHRAPMWAEHTTRPGWRAVAAFLPDVAAGPQRADRTIDPRTSPLLAIAYGYTGESHQWWHQQVHSGMRRSGWPPRATRQALADYFELTELHVHPAAQGQGLGAALLVRLLSGRPERSVLLSTPEVPSEDNRAWRLYRRYGFADIVRQFTFAGDTRPFAILGRRLPL